MFFNQRHLIQRFSNYILSFPLLAFKLVMSQFFEKLKRPHTISEPKKPYANPAVWSGPLAVKFQPHESEMFLCTKNGCSQGSPTHLRVSTGAKVSGAAPLTSFEGSKLSIFQSFYYAAAFSELHFSK